MSNLLFTEVTIEQQEIIVGGAIFDSIINSFTGNIYTIPDFVNRSLLNTLGNVNGFLNSFIPI